MSISQAELRIILQAQDQASAVLRTVSQSAIRAADDVGKLASTATSQLGNATRSVNDFGNAVKQGIGIGVGVGAIGAAFSAIGAGVGAAKSSVIDFNATMEQARIGFTTMFDNARKASTGLSDMATSGREAQNFMAQLQQFAQRTPFDLPSVVDGSRRLQAMGFQAQQVIPLLTDLGNATSALGGNAQTLDRLVLALGQMQAKGKVSGEEMRQLAEAGIPAWRILAEAMGKSQAEVMKLSETGQIASSTFINAFHQFAQNNFGGMMEQQSRTFQGAVTNIGDSLNILVGGAFEPLFAVISRVAIGLADFLQSDRVTAFGRDVQATMAEIVQGLAPIEGAFQRAFAAFQSGGVSDAMQSLVADFNSFGQELFGAGYNAVTEFAGGMLSAAGSVIQQAAEAVAAVVASFLVGQSPPPQGPLSTVDTGGEAVAEAWVGGFAKGFGSLGAVLAPVVDTLGNVGRQLSLNDAGAAFEGALGNLRAMQTVGQDVAGVLRGLGGVLRDAQSDQRDLANQARDIKDSYDAQITPLERQIQALKDAGSQEERNLELAQRQADLRSKQADLEDKARLNQLAQARIAAEGDPKKRAALQTQLDASKDAERELQLNQRAIDLARQITEQDQRRAQAKADGKPFDDKEYSTRIALLRNQQQQNDLERQLAGLTDKRALADIKAQEQAVHTAEDTRHIQEEAARLTTDRAKAEADIARAQRDQQVAGLEQQVRGLKQAEEDALTPVKAKEESVRRTVQTIQEEQGEWRALAQAISAAETAQRSREAQAKKDQKDAATAGLGNTPIDVGTVAITDAAQKAGTSFAGALRDSITAALPSILGGIGGAALGSTFGPLGTIAGAAFGVDLVAAVQAKVPNLTTVLGDAARTASQAFAGDWKPPAPDEDVWISPFVEMVGRISTRLGALFRQAQSGDVSGAIVGLLGDAGDLAERMAERLGEAVSQIKWGPIWAQVRMTAGDIIGGLASAVGTLDIALATWLDQQIRGVDWAALGESLGRSLIGAARTGAQAGVDGAAEGLQPETLRAAIAGFLGGVLTGAWQQTLDNWRTLRPGESYAAAFVEGLDRGGMVEALQAIDARLLDEFNQHRAQDLANIRAWNDERSAALTAGYDDWRTRQQAVFDDLVAQWNDHRAQDAAALAALAQTISDGWQAIWSRTVEAWDAIWGAVSQKAAEVTTAIQQQVQQWVDAGTQLGQGLVKAVGDALANLAETVVGPIRRAIESVRNMLPGGGGGNGLQTLSSRPGGGVTGGTPDQQIARAAQARGYEQIIPALIAYARHETGGYTSGLFERANNLFSLKGTAPGGGSVRMNDIGDGPSTFRAYESVTAAIDDFFNVVERNYPQIAALKNNAEAFFTGLQSIGWATDKNWATNVLNEARQVTPPDTSSVVNGIGRGGRIDVSAIDPKASQFTAGFMDPEDAKAACGPYAAIAFMKAVGRPPTPQEALQMARQVGWTRSGGMAGIGSEVQLVNNLLAQQGIEGIRAAQEAATPANIQSALAAGSPVGISTPKHYFVGTGFDPASGNIDVGATGTVLPGGKTQMTLGEIAALGGGIQGLIRLYDDLGVKSDAAVTQMGPGFEQAATDATAAADAIATVPPAADDAAAAVAGVGDAAAGVGGAIASAASDVGALGDAAGQAAQQVADGGQQAEQAMSDAATSITDSGIADAAAEQFQGIADQAATATEAVPQAMSAGLSDADAAVQEALRIIQDNAGTAAENVGSEIAAGAADGINQAAQDVIDAAAQMVQDALNAMADEAEVHSPSKKAYEIGSEIAAGLNQALADANTSDRARGMIQQFMTAAAAYAGVADDAADTEQKLLDLKLKEAQAQQALLPLTQAVAAAQREVEGIQRGSISDQLRALGIGRDQAINRREEVTINRRLRQLKTDPGASQDEVNALYDRLDVLKDQDAELSDQAELQKLNAQIASYAAQAQLLTLQDQQRQQDDSLRTIQDQEAALQAQAAVYAAQLAIVTNLRQELEDAGLIAEQTAKAIDHADQSSKGKSKSGGAARSSGGGAAGGGSGGAAAKPSTGRLTAPTVPRTTPRDLLGGGSTVTPKIDTSGIDAANQAIQGLKIGIQEIGTKSIKVGVDGQALTLSQEEALNLESVLTLVGSDPVTIQVGSEEVTLSADQARILDQTLHTLTDTAAEAGPTFEAAGAQMADGLAVTQDATDAVVEQTDQMAQGATAAAEDMQQGVTDATEGMQQDTVAAVDGMAQDAIGTTGDMEQAVTDTADLMQQTVVKTADTMADLTGAAGDAMEAAVSDAASTMSDNASQAADDMSNTVSSAADSMASSASSAAEEMSSAVSDAASSMADEASSAAEDMNSAVTDSAQQMADDAGGAADDMAGQVSDAAGSFDDMSSAADDATGPVQDVADAMSSLDSGPVEDLASAWDDLAQSIKKAAQAAKDAQHAGVDAGGSGGSGHAAGGIAEAMRMTLVGEHGPELLMPARRSMVLPATYSAAIMQRLRQAEQARPTYGEAGPVTTMTERHDHWNLTINSSAPHEPLVQDFATLRALSGGG